MPSSESEDFESADEGTGNIEKKERKKRHSSSNYSDNALENVPAPLKAGATIVKKITNEENQVYNLFFDHLIYLIKFFNRIYTKVNTNNPLHND